MTIPPGWQRPRGTFSEKKISSKREVSEFVEKIKNRPLPPQDQVIDLHRVVVPNMAEVENDMRLKPKRTVEARRAGKFDKKIEAEIPAWKPAEI